MSTAEFHIDTNGLGIYTGVVNRGEAHSADFGDFRRSEKLSEPWGTVIHQDGQGWTSIPDDVVITVHLPGLRQSVFERIASTVTGRKFGVWDYELKTERITVPPGKRIEKKVLGAVVRVDHRPEGYISSTPTISGRLR